jgi:hypothetical protein
LAVMKIHMLRLRGGKWATRGLLSSSKKANENEMLYEHIHIKFTDLFRSKGTKTSTFPIIASPDRSDHQVEQAESGEAEVCPTERMGAVTKLFDFCHDQSSTYSTTDPDDLGK